MAKLLYGDRISKLGVVLLGCSATIFDPTRQKVLLTRRTDNGRWCLPGGGLEPGESVTEACCREVREETGLDAEVVRLIGVYSDPHRLLEYADGNRFHLISLSFEVRVVGGELALSEETTAYGYFSRAEMAELDVMEHHLERIDDAFQMQAAAYVK